MTLKLTRDEKASAANDKEADTELVGCCKSEHLEQTRFHEHQIESYHIYPEKKEKKPKEMLLVLFSYPPSKTTERLGLKATQ